MLDVDLEYIHIKGLGGFRKLSGNSLINSGLEDKGFQAYADYMMTEKFDQHFSKFLSLISAKRTVYMCAERLPCNCHRYLLSDLIVSRGIQVVHIIDSNNSYAHELTDICRIINSRIIYPPDKYSSYQLRLWQE